MQNEKLFHLLWLLCSSVFQKVFKKMRALSVWDRCLFRLSCIIEP